MVYDVHVLYEGYSGPCDEGMIANCSCTLLRGRRNIIVDTMTPWDRERILEGLAKHRLTPEDITVVICTHGHSDHIGNNNLFLNAKHIVGYSVSYRDIYNLHPFEDGAPYIIDEDIKIIPTPGHTNADVSVLVQTPNLGIVAVLGDLFEREEDLQDPNLWRVTGGSENPKSQDKHRNEILLVADHIVPGHGPMFAVTPSMRKEAHLKWSSLAGSAPRSGSVDRLWKNPPGETNHRPDSTLGHRPSVWEGRLGPSNDFEDRQIESSVRRGADHGSRRDPRHDTDAVRVRSERDKLDRDPWNDRFLVRHPPNDIPQNPAPLLDDETLRRIVRSRNASESWDGRPPQGNFVQGETNWPDRIGPDSRLLPNERFGDRFNRELVRVDSNDRLPRDGRLGRDDRLMMDERLRRDDRMERDDRLIRDVRPIRDDRLVRDERFLRDDRQLRDERPARDDRALRDDRQVRGERLMRDERSGRNFGPPIDNKDIEAQSSRFGSGGKSRNERQERFRRGSRGRGARIERPVRGGSLEMEKEVKEGVRVSRRDEGFRRDAREARRPDDRTPRAKDDRPRKETRPRETDDFQERNIRPKHFDDGRNGGDGRTMRFHP